MSTLVSPTGAIVTHVDDPKPPTQVTPGFRQLVASGATLPITNWSRKFRTVTSAVPSRVTYCKHRLSDGYEYEHKTVEGHCGMASTSDMSFLDAPSSMVSALKAQAIDRAKNGAWDIGTFTAEAGKTYKLVDKAYGRARKRADRILDRKVGKVKTLQEFSDAWLEYRYGWRILAYDLESAQDSVQRFLNQYQLNRAFAEESLSDSTTAHSLYWECRGYTGGSSSGYLGFNPNTTTTYNRTTSVRVGAGVMVDTLAPFTINPVMTAWELTPWSFIFDWFVDVGTHIGAYTPTVGRTLDYLWMTTKRECVATSSLSPVAKPYNSTSKVDYRLSEEKAGNTQVVWTEIDRLAVEPDPLSIPRFKPNLSFPKFVDLAAIAMGKRRAIQRLLRA